MPPQFGQFSLEIDQNGSGSEIPNRLLDMRARVALIIPIYNGESYLENTADELEVFFAMNESHRVVFVDDGSTDCTARILAKMDHHPQITVISLPVNQGKGSAVRAGIMTLDMRSFDLIGFTDVELPYGLTALSDVMKMDADMIYGLRSHESSSYGFYRRCMKHIFRLLLPQSVRDIEDTQCGFKFFRPAVVHGLFEHLTSSRWVFDVELFLRARALSLTIASVPVVIKPSCLRGSGGVSLRKHGFRVWRDMSILRKRYE